MGQGNSVLQNVHSFVQPMGSNTSCVAPYHPSSNGLAERFVQTSKTAVKKAERDGFPLSYHLASFLLTYRMTPHATTGVSLCVLLMGRSLCMRLDLLHPNSDATVLEEQARQKQQHDEHSVHRAFLIAQQVISQQRITVI